MRTKPAYLFLTLLFAIFASSEANALCSAPNAAIGSLDFQGGAFKYCDGSSWLDLGGTSFPLYGPNGSAAAPTYSFSAGTNTGIYSIGAGTLNFATAGTAKMTIDSNGYVGIGTTIPGAPIDIVFMNNAKLQVRSTGNHAGVDLERASSSFLSHVTFNTSGALNWQIGTRDATNAFNFYNGSGQIPLLLTTSGELGIGTTSPISGTRLHTAGGPIAVGSIGSGTGNGGQIRFYDLGSASPNYVAFRAPDNVLQNVLWTLPTTDGTNGQVLYTNGSGSLSWANAGGDFFKNGSATMTGQFKGASGSAGAPSISFGSDLTTGMYQTTPGTLAFSTQGSERMRLALYNGRTALGIGTNDPKSTLHLNSSTTVGFTISNPTNTTDMRNYQIINASTLGLEVRRASDDYSSGSGIVLFGQNLKLGIGSYSSIGPSKDLSLSGYGSADKTMGVEETPSGAFNGGNGWDLTVNAGDATQGQTNKAGGDLYLRGGNSTGSLTSNIYLQTASGGTSGSTTSVAATSVAIVGSGNVGIGSTTPRAKLDVNGTMLAKPSVSNGTATVDFMTGNIQHTALTCQAFTFNNMKDGGSYTFVVQNTTSNTCSFTMWQNTGSGALTVHMPSDHGATTAGKHTLYSMLVVGTEVYVTWLPNL